MKPSPPYSRWRLALGWGAWGALALLGISLVSLLGLLTRWPGWVAQAREQAWHSLGHVVWFQASLLLAHTAWGFVAGAVAGALWPSVSERPLPAKAGGVAALFAAAVQVARTAAHKPALFEDALERHGGVRAELQRALTEQLGSRALDRGLWILLGTLFLILLMRRRLRAALVCGLAFGALILVGSHRLPWRRVRTPKAGPPSIVLVAADSLRPDHLSSEGYPRLTTPNLDRLRSQGLWFDRVFSPIASTSAAWASMFTGEYPHRHGIRDLFPRDEDTRINLPLLPELLARGGYSTAVVSDYAGETFSRIPFGFQLIDAPPATSVEIAIDREILQSQPLALGLFSSGVYRHLFPVVDYLPNNSDPAELTDRAEDLLDQLEKRAQPFFLVIFYSTTHTPFAVPMPDTLSFWRGDYRGRNRYSYDLQQITDIGRATQALPPVEVEKLRSLYDGALRSVDREVGRLVERLDADGVANRVVMFTGDHGESLFEPGNTTLHGRWFNGGEFANRVSLLAVGNGLPHRQIDTVVSGLDLTPTVLHLAGLPPLSGIQGRNLLQAAPERTVFAESALRLGGPSEAPPGALTYPGILDLLEVQSGSHALVLKQSARELTITAKQRAARRGPWELIYTPTHAEPRWELFNLERDPLAQRECSAQAPEVAASLQEELFGFLQADRLRWVGAGERVEVEVR